LAARITETAEAGIVVSENAEDQLVSSIKWLKSNLAERSRMGKNARQYAEIHFRIDHIADQFEAVFEKALESVD
jgi:glycosyltransferase involved in cell wall biosynthesis